MNGEFDIDNVPTGEGRCRWCNKKASWSTTAYSRADWNRSWSNLCHEHLGRLLERVRIRHLKFEVQQPVVTVEADR